MTDIVVVGSANQDYVVGISSLPGLGETVLAHSLYKQAGGRGVRQSIAASKLGARVVFVGCIGDDADGAMVLHELRSAGVSTVETEIASSATGMAVVYLSDDGGKSVAVASGANELLGAERVGQVITRVGGTDRVVLVQSEVGMDIIASSLWSAHACGSRTILSLSPYLDIPTGILKLVDLVVLTYSDASSLLSSHESSGDTKAVIDTIAKALPTSVVLSLDGDGAVWVEGEERGQCKRIFGERMAKPIGVGDIFVGALAKKLVDEQNLGDAVSFAVQAELFSIACGGMKPSYPTIDDLCSWSVKQKHVVLKTESLR